MKLIFHTFVANFRSGKDFISKKNLRLESYMNNLVWCIAVSLTHAENHLSEYSDTLFSA